MAPTTQDQGGTNPNNWIGVEVDYREEVTGDSKGCRKELLDVGVQWLKREGTI